MHGEITCISTHNAITIWLLNSIGHILRQNCEVKKLGLNLSYVLSQALLLYESRLKSNPLTFIPSCISLLAFPQQMTTNWVASNNRNLSLPFLEAEGWNSRCQQDWFHVEILREHLLCASLVASCGWRQSLVFLGLQLHVSNLSFCWHVTFSLRIFVSKLLSFSGCWGEGQEEGVITEFEMCGSLNVRGVWGRMDICTYRVNLIAIHLKLSQRCLLISYTSIQNKKV